MKSLADMAALFGQMAAGAYRENLSSVLDVIGSAVKKECENEIGEYQSSIGPFPPTAQLADATLERKALYGLGKGGNPDSPLWATGDYHDSIQTHKDVINLSVEIGTDVEYVKYHELGTLEMPPRPIFGPATLRALPPLLPFIAAAAAMGIRGGVWGGLSAEGITQVGGQATGNILP